MPVADIVWMICAAKAPQFPDAPFCKQQLALRVDMDTPVPDINLSAARPVDMPKNAAILARMCAGWPIFQTGNRRSPCFRRHSPKFRFTS